MPGKILDRYEQVPVTSEDLDWAELITLDLSKFEQPNGKEELVKELEHAVTHVGFFYVKNFNISQEEVDEQFALGREFYSLPPEDKLKYHNDEALRSGDYNGYRPAGSRMQGSQVMVPLFLGNGIKDNIQVYNIPKFDGFHERDQPIILKNNIKNIEKFSRKCHDEVVVKLLKLFALLLELPDEDQLVRDHQYDVKGEDHLRYMHYAARSLEDNKLVGEMYAPGHTDLGSITLLFRQPVCGLQILNSEGNWKWVKPVDGTITINTCDALTALTGGLIKSSIHRVHAPPQDQAEIDRLGVLYFSRPNNHVLLNPIENSPLLKRLGKIQNAFTELGQHITMDEWVKVRQQQQQRKTRGAKVTAEGKYVYDKDDLQILPGLHAKIHN